MQGYSLEDVAPGIDEIMVRQPLGVCAVITPFNFPLMIPLWFLPYAIATGNTVVLKPSDRVPFSAARLVELIQETGLPDGVVNLVNGGKPAVDALLDHPLVRAVSFVGSTPVAKHVYARGSASGSGCSARAAQRTTWWFCRTPTRRQPPRSLPIQPLGARGSVVLRSALR